MRKWLLPMALLLGATSAAAQTATPPSGDWNITFSTDNRGCEFSQSYAALGPDATLKVTVSPVDNGGTIEFSGFRDIASEDRKTVWLQLDGGAPPQQLSVYARSKADGGKVVAKTMDSGLLAGLLTARTLTLGTTHPIALDVAALHKGLSAMRGCNDALIRQWGLDPAAVHAVFTRPEAMNPGGWFGGPFNVRRPEKIRNGGRTVLLLSITDQGKIHDCRLLSTAGDKLDSATCAVAIANGHLKPGLDASGKRVPSWYVLPVRWAFDY